MSFSTFKIAFAVGVSGAILSGCATSTLIKKNNHTYTEKTKVTLIEDSVVAFGRPAQILENLSKDSLVIAGQKNSYILTQGGDQFASLITKLDAKNIQVTRDLSFYSEKNDGHFAGTLPLSYIKLKEEVSKKDLAFFIENGAKECSTESDERMQAQRFCFDIKLSGVIYPIANNLATFRALSKPYQVTIYTYKEENHIAKSNINPLEKLALLPFAIAIDVVSLPFQVAEKIFD